MIRAVVEALALFLVPFVAFFVYLLLRRRNPGAMDSWTGGTAASLSVAGLALAVLGIFVFGLFEHRPMGAYVPSHMEDGRFVPGHFE